MRSSGHSRFSNIANFIRYFRPAVAGCYAVGSAEKGTERAEALEASFEANVGDAAIRGAQKMSRPLQAVANGVAMRRHAECGLEGAMKMEGRKAGRASGVVQGNRIRKRGEQKIAAAEDAAKKFFACRAANRGKARDCQAGLSVFG